MTHSGGRGFIQRRKRNLALGLGIEGEGGKKIERSRKKVKQQIGLDEAGYLSKAKFIG